jgi:hypothetical protein
MSRIWFDLLILAGIILFVTFGPFAENVGLTFFYNVIVSKALLVSCGIIHSHIARELLFPYINFKTTNNLAHQLMVILLYVIIVFAWSRGG